MWMSDERDPDGAGEAARSDDEAVRATREAQEAHGGTMAPGLVDDLGRPVAKPPAEPEEG